MTTLIFANTALVIDHRSFLLSYLSQVNEFLNNLFGFALLKKMYFKLISEEIGFNFMENVIQFLTSQKKSDVAIIPLENNMAALRKGQFDVTSNLLGIERLPPQVPGFEVNLKNVTTSVIRDMRRHGPLPDELVFNLKIDGRPFFG